MGKKLTHEERQALVAQAQNAAAAKLIITMLKDAGLDTGAGIAAAITAATVIIETHFLPHQRLHILNSMLAETIHEWADSAAGGAQAGSAPQS